MTKNFVFVQHKISIGLQCCKSMQGSNIPPCASNNHTSTNLGLILLLICFNLTYCGCETSVYTYSICFRIGLYIELVNYEYKGVLASTGTTLYTNNLIDSVANIFVK